MLLSARDRIRARTVGDVKGTLLPLPASQSNRIDRSNSRGMAQHSLHILGQNSVQFDNRTPPLVTLPRLMEEIIPIFRQLDFLDRRIGMTTFQRHEAITIWIPANDDMKNFGS